MNMNIGLKNQERTIFSPKVFDLSRKFEFDHVETEQGKVIIIDHFYKNFEAVQQEIQKIPICELGTDEEIENRGEKFFIGRRSHVIGMRGTVPPYREMVSRLVYNYFSSIEYECCSHYDFCQCFRNKDFLKKLTIVLLSRS